MDQIKINFEGKLGPSMEESRKILDLQLLIEERLANDSGSLRFSEPVRQALYKYSKDRDILLKYVRGRKQDLQKALASIICLANVKHSMYPELFPMEMPDFVHHAINSGILSVLKNRDQLGRTIILFRASNWNVDMISLEEIICAGRYLTDVLMSSPEFLHRGVVLLNDCKAASLRHAKHFTVPAIIKFVNVFWQAYPIQIKGLYHVNAPLFVRPLYCLVKPFLPAKLKERVLITSGVNDLYKRVDVSILPESLGGHLPDHQAYLNSVFLLPSENERDGQIDKYTK